MFSAQNSQVSADFNYIEDVFSTWLYTGSASTQTITNNIDLSGKGGLTWLKCRNSAFNNILFDTARGDFELISNSTAAQADNNRDFVPLSTGFSLKGGENVTNNTGNNYVSWTFREQPKFFDIVTYTGNGVSGRQIAHSLGSTPGCMIIKGTNTADNWPTYHRSLSTPANNALILNGTNAALGAGFWTAVPTSTVFSLSADSAVNGSGNIYVAYLFAHDAGGFGLTGTDNVISCGSFTTDGSSNATITLGYEPQLVLTKRTDNTGAWGLYDNMRGWSLTAQNYLLPNTSGAEGSISGTNFRPTATGFNISSPYDASATYIYIAIRRGPMKVPTLGTSVFAPVLYTSNGGTQSITTGFPVDLEIVGSRAGSQGWEQGVLDRLRGNGRALASASTAAEANYSADMPTEFQSNTGVNRTSAYFNNSGSLIDWAFRRAPGFFDVVCFTGAGTALTVNHNLAATPELIIIKRRDGISYRWKVTSSVLTDPNTYYLTLDDTGAQTPFGANFIYNRTSTTFSVSSDLAQSGWTWVSYLFATCPGVSKVGSYTGTGALQTVNCGFTSGARFVLIKRIDSGSNWYVWDSTRGITSGNDPYLLLDTTAAEVTSTNYVDTDATGFKVTAAAPIALNASGGTYLFLAIA